MIKNADFKGGWQLDNSYGKLPEIFYSNVKPTPVSAPKLAILNNELAENLGLDGDWLQSDEGLQVLAGNKIPLGSSPIAQAYAGHQFGHFTMLGDGRAVLIGEQKTPSGERVDIQLKGSGRTPYSRRGDGRAALGPMLREYIISEAMYGLGIPTTRSLAVVTTGEEIIRETRLLGAILTRIASSHIRVGTFQFAATRGTIADLKLLADYTIKRHFAEILEDGSNPYISLLKEVIKKQADLIAKWQLVGFIHGVMNTDNMALSGETIDYGPCAFMDSYDPKTVFSSIDAGGRYAYGNQPAIAQWNLARFAETLLPLIDNNEERAINLAKDEILNFSDIYQGNWLNGMRAKLGIYNENPEDEHLIEELLEMMLKYNADFTNTFISLAFDKPIDTPLFESEEFNIWRNKWMKRLSEQKESVSDAQQLMRNSNPALIPRNHRVEEALEKATVEGDYGSLKGLLDVLSKPYSHTSAQACYKEPAGSTGKLYRTFCGT